MLGNYTGRQIMNTISERNRQRAAEVQPAATTAYHFRRGAMPGSVVVTPCTRAAETFHLATFDTTEPVDITRGEALRLARQARAVKLSVYWRRGTAS